MAVTAGTLADTIVEAHAFLAELTEIKRLEMPRDDAAKLARAVANANRHIRIPMLNSRNAALAMLAWVACRIYLPMGKAVFDEMSAPKRPVMVASAVVVAPSPPAGGIIPVPNDDAALAEWLPGQVQ